MSNVSLVKCKVTGSIENLKNGCNSKRTRGNIFDKVKNKEL